MPQRDEIIVYTCVTGGYDKLRPVRAAEPGVSFVCFTDSPRRIPHGWHVRPLQSPHRLTNGHDINRYHKMFPHRLFPDNRFSIYLDGNVWFDGKYRGMVQGLQSHGACLGAFRHPKGRGVFEESEMCVRLNKLHRSEVPVLEQQLRCYEGEGFNLSTSITVNNLLARDHCHSGFAAAMALWWSQLFEFTSRDQLSLNYVLWKTGIPWIYLDCVQWIARSNLERYPHRTTLQSALVSSWRKWLRLVAYAKRRGGNG